MYEFHGWVTLSESPRDIDHGNLRRIVAAIRERIPALNTHGSSVDLKLLNAQYCVLVAGFGKRIVPMVSRVLDFFQFVARLAPGSYGLFYLWDDNDDEGRENEFQVWRLTRGKVEPSTDPFFSPCIPTIEDDIRESPESQGTPEQG